MTEQRARRDSRRRHELAVLVDPEAREQATQRGTLCLSQRRLCEQTHRCGRDRLRCAPLEEQLRDDLVRVGVGVGVGVGVRVRVRRATPG